MPRDVYLRLLRDCLPLQCVEKVTSVDWLRVACIETASETLSFAKHSMNVNACRTCVPANFCRIVICGWTLASLLHFFMTFVTRWMFVEREHRLMSSLLTYQFYWCVQSPLNERCKNFAYNISWKYRTCLHVHFNVALLLHGLELQKV